MGHALRGCLSEYLSHLAKTLLLAEAEGHRTIGLLYGGSAAGAFIVTALATGTLVALPGAHPSVMDLPSMARVTKLPIEVIKAKAEATPVFAPGLDNMVMSGGSTSSGTTPRLWRHNWPPCCDGHTARMIAAGSAPSAADGGRPPTCRARCASCCFSPGGVRCSNLSHVTAW
ncbi:biotin-independent malonate decarboxylase, gamma subunit [Bradyrhizobium sp. Gha]|nr:biotin-independent malonate decarboxylase, gamma subunit [Bradyrhizobium sp. Gha]